MRNSQILASRWTSWADQDIATPQSWRKQTQTWSRVPRLWAKMQIHHFSQLLKCTHTQVKETAKATLCHLENRYPERNMCREANTKVQYFLLKNNTAQAELFTNLNVAERKISKEIMNITNIKVDLKLASFSTTLLQIKIFILCLLSPSHNQVPRKYTLLLHNHPCPMLLLTPIIWIR